MYNDYRMSKRQKCFDNPILSALAKFNLSEFLCFKGIYLYMQCHTHNTSVCKVVWLLT